MKPSEASCCLLRMESTLNDAFRSFVHMCTYCIIQLLQATSKISKKLDGQTLVWVRLSTVQHKHLHPNQLPESRAAFADHFEQLASHV